MFWAWLIFNSYQAEIGQTTAVLQLRPFSSCGLRRHFRLLLRPTEVPSNLRQRRGNTIYFSLGDGSKHKIYQKFHEWLNGILQSLLPLRRRPIRLCALVLEFATKTRSFFRPRYVLRFFYFYLRLKFILRFDQCQKIFILNFLPVSENFPNRQQIMKLRSCGCPSSLINS